MKQMWIPKERCTGCEACMNACPQNAISLRNEIDGFFYPLISDSCIECNICSEVCNLRTEILPEIYKQRVFAAWSKSNDIRFQSTSGGIFSELAYSILNKEGYVIGAVYDNAYNVKHCVIHNNANVSELRQSKYVQSEIGDVLRIIKELLNDHREVMFCGTPCQIAGLKAFLRKPYDNLLTIDFICRGVNSPLAFKSWVQELENHHKSTAKKVWFKYKDGGWKTSPTRTRVDFANGEFEVFEGEKNLFMQGYFANLYLRPSCSNCEFKGVNRYSDLTLGDFWGIDEKIDDDKGVSLVMINSAKGQELFYSISNNITSEEKEIEEAYNKNPCLFDSVPPSIYSKQFLKNIKKYPFSKAYGIVHRSGIRKSMKEFLKSHLHF